MILGVFILTVALTLWITSMCIRDPYPSIKTWREAKAGLENSQRGKKYGDPRKTKVSEK